MGRYLLLQVQLALKTKPQRIAENGESQRAETTKRNVPLSTVRASAVSSAPLRRQSSVDATQKGRERSERASEA